MGEVLVIVAGAVGSGKSAVLGEIEIALRAIGLTVRYSDDKQAQIERALTHADWETALATSQPQIVLMEQIERPVSRRADEILSVVPAGPGWGARMRVAVDYALNDTWWRGYTAGLVGSRHK
jgi:hypothetical protein